MSTFSVPPGCMGVELPGGKKIDADKRGHVNIEETRDQKWAMKSGNATIGAFARTAITFRTNSESKFCDTCFFEGFKWQTECPHCGSTMTTLKETQ